LKKKINNILFVAVVLTLNFSIKSQVLISNSGEEIIDSNNPSLGSFAFSLGEPVINTLSDLNSNELITQGFQQPLDLTTSLTSSYCGDATAAHILSDIYEEFECVEVYNTHHYLFNFYDTNGNLLVSKHTANNANKRKMSLNLAGLNSYGQTYKVTVQAIIFSGGGTTKEATFCYIKTNVFEETTKLTSVYCGTDYNNTYQLSSINEFFECELIPNTHHYIFNFYDDPDLDNIYDNLITSIHTSNNSNKRRLNLYKAGLSQTNSTYRVGVQAVKFSGLGTTNEAVDDCFISVGGLQSIDLLSQYCGGSESTAYSLTSNSDVFECENVSNTHHYIFNFYDANGNLLISKHTKNNSNKRKMSLSLAGSNYFTSPPFQVKVQAVLFSGGGTTPESNNGCWITNGTAASPGTSLIDCQQSGTPTPISDNDVIEAEIEPAINSTYEYRYIFKLSINGTFIKTCTTSNNNNRRKLCLKGTASGITSAKLNSLNIGDIITIEVEAWVKNGYNPSGPFPIIIPNEALCYATYTGAKSIFISENKIKLKLYPNPNDGTEFYINAYGFENIKDNIEISITDIYGKIVYHEKLNNNATQIITTINLNTPISAGVYLVKVAKGENVIIKKMVVQ